MKRRKLIAALPAVDVTPWQPGLMLLVALLMLTACSIVQPRRDDPAPCTTGNGCDRAMIEHATGYRLGYVQFDDDGHYAEAGQIGHVLNDFSAVSNDGLILVAFAHGWKENAGAKRWSVAAFRAMLAAIEQRERHLAIEQSRAPRLVAGVFLGWPGYVNTLPGLNGFTWFDREDAAERIARADFGDTLLQMKTLRDRKPANDGTARNQLILVGHSLGATMLFQHLAGEPLRGKDSILTPLADLVLLLSPAIPAADVQALAKLGAADRTVLPPILAITSEGDATLRLAYPLAQWLDRPLDDENAQDPTGYRAMGTYAPLITHRLELRGDALALMAVRASTDDPALLQIAASPAVMRGHKDIANPRLVGFIAEVAALQIDNRMSRTSLASAFPAAAPAP